MRRATRGLAAVALVALAALAGGGGAAAQNAAPKHVQPHWGTTPKRVLIVLFDQMRPEYADRFDMKNFKRVRDAGTNFNSGVPRLHGLRDGDQPQRDRVRPGAEAHGMGRRGVSRLGESPGRRRRQHVGDRRPDARPVRHARQPRGLPEAGGLPACGVPGHEVHHGRREVIRRGVAPTAPDRATSPCGCPAVSPTCPAADRRARNLGGAVARTRSGKNVPTYLEPQPEVRALLHQLGLGQRLRHDRRRFPSWMYPEDGNRFFPGHDPAHLGGDTWAADAAIDDDGARELVGHVRHAGRRSTRPATCGAPTDDRQSPRLHGSAAVQTHVRCAAENADGQLGRDARQARRQLGRAGRDAGRADGRPRRDLRQALLRQERSRTRGDTNWYYGRQASTTACLCHTRSRRRRWQPLIATGNVQFSYQSTGDRDLAEGSLAGQEGGGRRDHEDAARA